EQLEIRLGLRQGDIAADARAVIAPFRAQHLVSLDAKVSPIDLARFGEELPHAALSLTANATGTERGLKGTFTLTNAAPGPPAQEGMSLKAEAVRRGDTVEINSLRAAAAGGEVTGSGTVRLTDPLAFRAKLALAHFDPAAFGDYPQGAISGSVVADGDLAKES